MTLPLIIIAYSQSTGALFGRRRDPDHLRARSGLAWLLALALLSTGFRSLTRGRLLGVADER